MTLDPISDAYHVNGHCHEVFPRTTWGFLKQPPKSSMPICSTCGIFTYIWAIFGFNVGKYFIQWASGMFFSCFFHFPWHQPAISTDLVHSHNSGHVQISSAASHGWAACLRTIGAGGPSNKDACWVAAWTSKAIGCGRRFCCRKSMWNDIMVQVTSIICFLVGKHMICKNYRISFITSDP